MFCTVDIGDEVFVLQAFFYDQIHFATEQPFEGFLKIEIVGDIIPLLVVGGVEIDEQVHIALIIEPIGQD